MDQRIRRLRPWTSMVVKAFAVNSRPSGLLTMGPERTAPRSLRNISRSSVFERDMSQRGIAERSKHHKEVIMYDMKNLAKLKLLEVYAPEATKAFWAFDKAAWAEGA